jgi:glycine cleavage system T protein (aminomethyltransferase)
LLKTTPFHERTAALCASHAWRRWAGYVVASSYELSHEREYHAIRGAAALFDISPLCKYRIRGRDAEAFCNRLVTRDVRKLAPGSVAYVLWCDDRGKVIDDGTLFRIGVDEFRLCAQERHLLWLEDSALGFDVEIADVTADVAALSLQGPTSCAVLKALGLSAIERLRPFGMARFPLGRSHLEVSRTGFTGDLGYELWTVAEAAAGLWDRLMSAGRLHGLRAIGWQPVEIARIEAGFLLVGVDYLAADHVLRPNRARSPFELGFERLVDFDKGHFNGRRALLAEKEAGGGRLRVVGLDIAGNKPAAHALLYSGRSREVGQVTSAVWSPTAKKNIAIATIERAFADGQRPIWADIYVQKELKWSRSKAACRVVERPFWNPPRRWAVPAQDR